MLAKIWLLLKQIALEQPCWARVDLSICPRRKYCDEAAVPHPLCLSSRPEHKAVPAPVTSGRSTLKTGPDLPPQLTAAAVLNHAWGRHAFAEAHLLQEHCLHPLQACADFSALFKPCSRVTKEERTELGCSSALSWRLPLKRHLGGPACSEELCLPLSLSLHPKPKERKPLMFLLSNRDASACLTYISCPTATRDFINP